MIFANRPKPNGIDGKGIRPVLLGLVLTAALSALATCSVYGEIPRHISANLQCKYYMLDSDYFGLNDAAGVDLSLRYEIGWNTFFENCIGAFHSESAGTGVGGFDYRLGVMTILPVMIPNRPIARLGIGFQAIDPVIVTPAETFRPSQTTFYLILGGGITRTIRENTLVEAGADIWLTPYRYRIYKFDWPKGVRTDEKQFTHITLSLGISYIF